MQNFDKRNSLTLREFLAENTTPLYSAFHKLKKNAVFNIVNLFSLTQEMCLFFYRANTQHLIMKINQFKIKSNTTQKIKSCNSKVQRT